MVLIFLIILTFIFNDSTYSYIELDEVHAYVFERYEKGTFDNWWLVNVPNFPKERKEIEEVEGVYLDQRGVGIYITIWPRPDYIGQVWHFQFISPKGTVIDHTLKYTGEYPYDWLYDNWIKIDEPYSGFFRQNFYGRFTGFTEITRCTTGIDGNWVLRFKEGDAVLKEWNFTLKPIDRGQITLELQSYQALPDGLEEEPNSTSGGDRIDLTVNFNKCTGNVENQSIHLKNKFNNGTGGHNHNETVECINNISRDLYSYCGDFTRWDITTDENGNGTSTFISPYYSGTVDITAYTYSGLYEGKHTKSVDIKVPGLVPMGSSIAFILYPDNEGCEHGALNHNYNQNALKAFRLLAIYWYYSDYNPNNKLLKFTAGSLPWGGKFDDGVCWSSHSSSNHHYHRQGRDCDISTRYSDGTYMNQNQFLDYIRSERLRNLHLTLGDHNSYHTHVRYSGN